MNRRNFFKSVVALFAFRAESLRFIQAKEPFDILSVETLMGVDGVLSKSFVFYTQQVDPAYASGRMQDAIARIYYTERRPGKTMAQFERRRKASIT